MSDNTTSPPIVYFDATVRRKEKMKLASQHANRFRNMNENPDPPLVGDEDPAEVPVAFGTTNEITKFHPSMTSPESNWPVSPPSQVFEPEVAKTAILNVAVANHVRQPDRLESTKMTAFVVNFVVEQTGYPPDMVELDADLEADLGIDSITLAQLLGEVRDYCGVTPSAHLNLSDFATLNDVVRIFQESAMMQVANNTSLSI